MKTTHQIARELLDMPDAPLHIEMWGMGRGDEIGVVEVDEDCHPAGGVMLVRKPGAAVEEDGEIPQAFSRGPIQWMNICDTPI